jgi:hypothetical protein
MGEFHIREGKISLRFWVWIFFDKFRNIKWTIPLNKLFWFSFPFIRIKVIISFWWSWVKRNIFSFSSELFQFYIPYSWKKYQGKTSKKLFWRNNFRNFSFHISELSKNVNTQNRTVIFATTMWNPPIKLYGPLIFF